MGMGWDGNEVRCWKTIAPDEKFFGLGEKTGNLDKRGREYVMWNSDTPGYTNDTDPLYQSIPFFIGLRGGQAYGIFFNNSYRTRFNMGAGNERYYSFAAEDGPLDYFFIAGPRIPDVVERYTELTGRTPMPPKWALGFQQCRWSYFPDDEVLRIARTFREKQIPADVIYLDIHYMNGYRVFTWDRERFPDPVRMVKNLNQIGFKLVTIIDPGVKADSSYMVANEGLANNYFVRYPDSTTYVGEVWPGKSYFPDFTKMRVRDWWGSKIGDMLKLGVDGFWNDMNEPACWGQAFPLETIFDDEGHRSGQKKIHNQYGFWMAQSAYDGVLRANPDTRPFIITRAGFAGEQRFTAVWTGDNVSNEDHLELGLRMMEGLGLSGVPFVGTDVGGFMGTPSGELMARWMQVGALSPFFRAHSHYGSVDKEPWSFGENIEAINKRTIVGRYHMLPYFYSLFWDAHETGAPLLRPLFWNDQDDPKCYEWEYQQEVFVGDKLLAAPVTRVGQNFKAVYLPVGRWLDWNTQMVYQGPQRIIVDTPLDRLPLFLREGAIIPSQEATQWIGEKPATKLFLDVFPGSDESSYVLYEDDGLTQSYTRGAYRLTKFTVSTANGFTLVKSVTQDRYAVPMRDLELHIHAVEQEPKSVTLDGSAVDRSRISYDAARHMLTVRVPERGNEQTIEFQK
jgi:alpha-glucosidase